MTDETKKQPGKTIFKLSRTADYTTTDEQKGSISILYIVSFVY